MLAFVLTMLLLQLALNLLERGLSAVRLQFFNRLTGGLALGGLALVVYSLVAGWADESGLIAPDQKSASISYPFVRTVPDRAQYVWEKARPSVERARRAGEDAYEDLRD